MVGTTRVKSSSAFSSGFAGLLECKLEAAMVIGLALGVVRGEGAEFWETSLVGEGMLDSLPCGACAALRPIVLFGDESIVLGVLVLGFSSEGLDELWFPGASCPRIE